MRIRLVFSMFLADLAVLALAALAASVIRYGTPWVWEPEAARGGLGPLLASLLVGLVVGSYVSTRAWGNGIPRPSYGRALWIWLTMVGTAALFTVMTRTFYSRGFLALATGGWLVLALAYRTAARRRPWTETMVVITGEKGLADDLVRSPNARVLEVLDPLSESPPGPLPEKTTLAVDLRAVLSEEMARFVSSTSLAGYPVRSFTGVYEEHTGRLPIVHLAEGWELSVPVGSRGIYEGVKRMLDTALVIVTSPITLVVGAAIALAIRMESGGPAIFSQARLGRHDEPFTMHKFRTMRVHSESEESRYPLPDDPRLTRVGRLLRRYRADELPQLWDVLLGNVSLVGPRPEWTLLAEEYATTIPVYSQRHLVRPGITGWAQVNFGYADSEADVIEKLSYDLYYVKHMSVWLDLQILGKSFWTVLSGYGAQ
jgi:lipopolysaccharide/colanic/teichoic acid biosynthesis glycosyltransferase